MCRIKVKICGITNLEDALAAVESGCDALGFVFYKKSPRYITPEKARSIIALLPKRMITVGVFVNAAPERMKRIARLCGLKMLQLHGDETPQAAARLKGYKVIKAFRVKDKDVLCGVPRYKVYAWLFDTYTKSKPGGTGRRFEWRILSGQAKFRRPVFLAGGLNARNVDKAVKELKPQWLDVSSAVESSPGKKDPAKLKAFINAVRKIRV